MMVLLWLLWLDLEEVAVVGLLYIRTLECGAVVIEPYQTHEAILRLRIHRSTPRRKRGGSYLKLVQLFGEP